MSRILVLIPVALWFVWADAYEWAADAPTVPVTLSGLVLFLSGMGLLILLGAWSGRRRARLEAMGRVKSGVAAGLVRGLAVPALLAWFATGIFALGWGNAVWAAGERIGWNHLALPGAVVATFPAYGAWAILLLTDYPIVRHRREHRLLFDLDQGRPVYAPPTAVRYWILALRQHLLFALIPLVLVLCLRDGAMVAFALLGARSSLLTQSMTLMASVSAVILLSPELMRRLLPTRPLEPGPLRDRLEALCSQTSLRVRNILVWDTDGTQVNAAVVGLLPRLRYVMLSDLMLDSMTPQQVEAVFAHEIGHIKHRHLPWYVVFLIGITLVLSGPIDAMWRSFSTTGLGEPIAEIGATLPYAVQSGLASAVVLLGILMLFGLLSRCFERQADVFAARMHRGPGSESADRLGGGGSARALPVVDRHGAALFASSLLHAARFNHLPARRQRRAGPIGLLLWAGDQLAHFLHGTITSRVDFVQRLADHPARTRWFDLRVAVVKGIVLGLALGSAVWLYLFENTAI